ncbi:glycosyltransferase family 9 protein [bacterium]|nr:glycosyltransferase family 9 protein [bacterium]HPF36025.1 glycosyltransferase family 9 protein [Candidatus Krumholzibacteria bacterium]HRX50566.1 glycosyltransferase family 9 protein [Candidatus Krumholzibacteria bacterium]
MEIRRDCLHFRGDVPCAPHKERGRHCADCPEHVSAAGRILLIKLGAAGDVVRTTPLLAPLRARYPHHRLTWLTDFPDLVPRSVADRRRFDAASVLWARNTRFDVVLNLDKDPHACALATEVDAEVTRGFLLGDDGLCRPADDGAALAKFRTGVFDDVNRANTLSYPQEIFAICGFEFAGEPYELDRPDTPPVIALPQGRPLVGLNTGCGGRWTSRLWPEERWIALTRLLQDDGLGVVLLGGPEEHARNERLAAATGAAYPGTFPLRDFIGVMDRCQVVVSAVTMAMHLAIGLGKELVLFNNIFNPAEFELYGRGEIVSPDQRCRCFFAPRCRESVPCMSTLRPEAVREAVHRRLGARA